MPAAQECHELPWPDSGMFSIRSYWWRIFKMPFRKAAAKIWLYTSVFVVINNIMLYRNKILHNRATHFVDRTFLSRDYLYHDTIPTIRRFLMKCTTLLMRIIITATKFRTVKHVARRPAVLYYYSCRRSSQSSLQYYYLPSERKRPSWRGGRCGVSLVIIYCLHTI